MADVTTWVALGVAIYGAGLSTLNVLDPDGGAAHAGRSRRRGEALCRLPGAGSL